MAIIDLFSKRQARLRGGPPDVFKYDEVPGPFRVQIIHIFRDLMHENREEELHANRNVKLAYENISDWLCREYGLFRLSGESYERRDHALELFNFVLGNKNHNRVLDCIELVFQYADRCTRNWEYLRDHSFDARVDSAIAELNQRFKEHGLGYQYEQGELVRVDSDLLHAEAVKPALTLLRSKRYAGPREEFLRAYEHYRHGRHEEALTEALKAFESTMKAICDSKKWAYDKNAPSKKLVDVCFKNNLVDSFWQTHFAHLQGSLENGIATARNKLGGHGQGAQPRSVPAHIVSYVLHMTASTIVFLIQSADG